MSTGSYGDELSHIDGVTGRRIPRSTSSRIDEFTCRRFHVLMSLHDVLAIQRFDAWSTFDARYKMQCSYNTEVELFNDQIPDDCQCKPAAVLVLARPGLKPFARPLSPTNLLSGCGIHV